LIGLRKESRYENQIRKKADKDAKYSAIKKYNISKLEPQVAKPHAVDNVATASKLRDVVIDEAFLGTCTNGRFEDLMIAAKILKGKTNQPKCKINCCSGFKEFPGSVKKWYY
jgi:3-isopropylmalate dehydratase, large subunit (EC 4.2.1.33)